MKKPKALALLCVLMCLAMVSADVLPLLANCQTQAAPTEKENVNGAYVVSVLKHGQWQEAGRLGYDMFLKEKCLDLSGWLAKNSSAVVKISQEGGEAAHLDSVFLGGEAPQSVNCDDGILLVKLSKRDLDLANAAPDGIELMFPANRSNDILTVTGRIEGKNISKEPFKFPSENTYREINKGSRFYTYNLNSVSKQLTIDGILDEINGIEPFFKEYCVPGSGHPEGYIYCWVMNTDEYLNVILDVTPDNTMDGDKDYAAVYVNTKAGLKEFKVSVPETKWGKPAFTYTDKVDYQHKIYEFKIPIEEIGCESSESLQLAFSVYGTVGPGEYPMASFNPALAYNPDKYNYLLVYTNQKLYGPSSYKSEAAENPGGETSRTNDIGIVGQFISNTAEAQGSPFLISEELGEYIYSRNADYPEVAYGDNIYLVVWQVKDRYNEVTNIMGIFLDEEGNPYTDVPFTIVEDVGDIYENNLTVAYGEEGSFLVAWYSFFGTDPGDILGREVKFDSSDEDKCVISNIISICTEESAQVSPSAAYSAEDHKFLVVWEDERDYTSDENCPFSNIYGAYLKRSGTGELAVDEEIPVYTGKYYQSEPSVAYNSNSDRFVITWIHSEDSKDSICGVLVNENGSVSQEETKLIAGEPDDSTAQYYEYLSTVYNPVLPDEYFSVWFIDSNDEEGPFGMGQQSPNTLVPSGSSCDFGKSIYNIFDPKLDIACNTNEGNYLVAYPCIHRYPVEYPAGDIRPKADTTINNCYIKWELIGEAHENPGIIQFKVDDVIDGYDYFEGDCIYYGVDESHGILEIPVERFGGFSGEVTVTYDVYGNARDPWDYEILGDYPTFSGSESEEMIRIRIIDDDVVDPGKYIELLIYDAEDAELGDIIRAKIYIDDNDSATVKFSSSSYTVAENVYENTGKNYSEIKVLFSGFRPIEASKLFSSYEWEEEETVFSVVYETFDGTASEGEDYTAVSGLLHFGGEAGERTFRVPIIDDNKDEANETVNLRLSFPGQEAQSSGSVEGDTLWIGGSPVTLSTPKTATLTIIDDDTAPSRPRDKKDKDKPSVAEPPKETPPPVEGLPDDALVDRMPGYIVLSTPVKINTVSDEISLSCNTDKLAGNPGHDARIYYWNPEVSKWVALATYPDGSGKVKAINDGGYKGWFVVFGVIQPHFADINSHWAEQLINRMNGLGLIEGYALKDSDMRVAKPEQKVTRAEFIMFVTRIMNMNPDNILLPDITDSETESTLTQSYTDASEISPWVRAAVAKATKAGLVPFEGSSFKPLEPITRIEAAVMVSRALKKFKDFKAADLNSFKDSSDIPGWAAGQVVENVLEGYPDNTLKPNSHMARAESLAMLMRLFIKGLGW